jgi:2',3'-cyclic-nucleotide 2'-phosphodiesterase (5'-nucleotidase family)
MYLVQQCGFPWLIGNVFDGEKPLGNALQTYLLTASNGIKIGLMGLVEKFDSDFEYESLLVEIGLIRLIPYPRI